MKFLKRLSACFFISMALVVIPTKLSAKPGSSEGRQDSTQNSLDPFHCQGDSRCNRLALQDIEKAGFKCLGYDGARMQIFHVVDVYWDQGRAFVDSVYSTERIEPPHKGLPDGNEFNTEHTYPQSLLKSNSRYQVSRADLYHLFPTESKINGIRGNLPFAECETNNSEEGKLCPGNRSFMPPKKQRGNTARAMFYMSVMYGLEIPEAEENVLRKWNKEFPPNEQEIERMKRIEVVQGNTNPFITHPEFVSLISNF